MPITDAGSHDARDIIQLGMDADDVRRQRHGTRTTFVRVADIVAESDAAPIWPPAAGEIRIIGTPSSRAAAVAPFDRLADPRRSIEEVNIAGLSLARLTIERRPADAVAVYKAVAALQRTVAVVRAFAPLARTLDPAVPTTGYDDVRHVALARIIVHNVPSIQVDWSRYGPKL